jgi:hypothetical protein
MTGRLPFSDETCFQIPMANEIGIGIAMKIAILQDI